MQQKNTLAGSQNSIFRNKRKWGAAVSVPPDEHKQIWINIRHDTPAVAHFLSSNPCVILGAEQRLNGLFVTDDPQDVTPKTEKKWHKLYAK